MAKPLKLDQWGVWIRDHKKPSFKKPLKMTPLAEIRQERRAIVRRAYFLIRHDPDKKDLVREFAKALGGKIDLTDAILNRAHQIVHDHGGATLQ